MGVAYVNGMDTILNVYDTWDDSTLNDDATKNSLLM